MDDQDAPKADDQITFRTKKDLKSRVEKVAKLTKRSVAFYCNEYLEAGLKKDEKKLKRQGKL